MLRLLSLLLLSCSAAPLFPPGDGGTEPVGPVDLLWFATTGDTRPPGCDQTDLYPRETMAQIARSMKSLRVQFALDLGDHMFVCNGSIDEARQQMGFYMSAVSQGPAPFFMTLGNHEAWGVNLTAYLEALGKERPWYSFEVQTRLGPARFVIVADDAWSAEQADWLEQTLAAADRQARYTIVARHHPLPGSRHEAVSIIERHRYSLVLSAHLHTYRRANDHGGRAPVIGLGGAPGPMPAGFATVAQEADGRLTFVLRDVQGNPWGTPWSVPP